MNRDGDSESGGIDGLVPAGSHGAALAALADVAVSLDADGTVEGLRDEAPATLGHTEEVCGRPVSALLAAAGSPEGVDTDATGTGGDDVERLLDPDGDAHTVSVRTAEGGAVPMTFSTVERPERDGVVCLGRVAHGSGGPSRGSDTSDLIGLVADPVYALDPSDRFERVNDAFVQRTEYDRDTLLGRDVAQVLPGSAYASVTAELRESVAPDESASETVETPLVTREGDSVLTEVNVTVYADSEGACAGTVGVARDVRERKRREQNLDLLNSVFTRVFRHNVRNELAVVESHAERLAEEVDEALRSHPEAILRTTERLLRHSEKARLIERVIETDERTDRDLARATRSVVADARERHPAATIETDLPGEAVVRAHPDIDRAVEELIDNAVEHAPEESAHVEVWFDRRPTARTLFVEDTAGGLADHEIEVLRRGRERDLQHSTGVGLWLIRWLAEYSGAKLIVHRTDQGSLMGLTFPAEAPDDRAHTSVAESSLARAPAAVRDVSLEQFRGAPVVERVDALDELTTAYDALSRSGGQFVVVRGEAGVGKTTLIEQFHTRLTARDSPPVVATGVCDPEGQSAYRAVARLLDDLPGARDASAVLADTGDTPDSPEATDQYRRALFADVADEFREAATDRPVVAVVEDLQHADGDTVDLLQYLLEEVGRWGLPVMFVGSYRTGDVGQSHPVRAIATEASESGRGTVLELEPLDPDQTASLLSHTLDLADPPSSFVDAVHEHTGGTPLFVTELGRHMADRLESDPDAATLPRSAAALPVPDTVERTITRRLDALPTTVRPVLHLGAVFGREFSFDLLRAATDRPVGAVVDAVETLVDREVWEQSADEIAFAHGVVREQTLDRLDEAERERLHADAAAAIETRRDDAHDDAAGRLGYHRERAGDETAAFQHYRRAGDRAAETYANDDAVEYYERALALAADHDVTDTTTRAAVAKDLGDVHRRRGEYDRAESRYRESHTLSERAGDRDRVAETLRELGTVAYYQADYPEARERYEESLAIERELGDRDGEADSLHNLGIVAMRRDETERAREHFRESLRLSRAVGDRTGEASSLRNLGIVALERGDTDEAREYFEESLEISRERGARTRARYALDNLGGLAKRRGAYDRSRERYEECLAIEREIGDRRGEQKTLRSLGNLARLCGAYDRAEDRYDESLAIAREIDVEREAALTRSGLGALARCRGEYDEARDHFERSLAIRREVGDRDGQASTLHDLGVLAVRQGAHDRAAEHFEEALKTSRAADNPLEEAHALCGLGRLARRRGRLDRATERLTEALDAAEEGDLPTVRTEALCQLGVVARQRGAHDDAAQHLTDALSVPGVDERRRQRARVRLERARLALDQGDFETARERVERAHGTLAEMGATHDRARATAVRGRLAARAGSPDEAREHWRTALDVFEAVDAPQDALATLERLVEACRRQGDTDRASEYRSRAESLLADAPDPLRALHGDWLDRD